MIEINYARAQARYLALKFPNEGIDVENVVSVCAEFERGYAYSSYTFEDGSFQFVIDYKEGGRKYVYHYDSSTVDLTEMVVEGLRLELEAVASSGREGS